jgi:hypothetical protein
MKKVIYIISIILVMLISGCSDSTQVIKSENQQLKNKISQFEKDSSDKNSQRSELQNKAVPNLTINYIENTNSKRFVEKQCDLLGLPVDNSIRLNTINENTVVTILDTVNVNNIIWLYVQIPVYDSPSNMKGWIKQADTILYTTDEVKNVQSGVFVKKGEAVYQVYEFGDIKSATPYKTSDELRGRIEEKRDGYVRLNCSGGNTVWVKEASVIYPEVD